MLQLIDALFNHKIIQEAGVIAVLTRKITILIILITTLALTACGDSTNKSALTGVITHTHRMTLSNGYVLTIRILDTTKADTPGKKIAEEVIKCQGEVLPIPFAIIYDPGKINQDHTYTLRVEIADSNGKVTYTNTAPAPVITHGNPTRDVKVVVVLPDE